MACIPPGAAPDAGRLPRTADKTKVGGAFAPARRSRIGTAMHSPSDTHPNACGFSTPQVDIHSTAAHAAGLFRITSSNLPTSTAAMSASDAKADTPTIASSRFTPASAVASSAKRMATCASQATWSASQCCQRSYGGGRGASDDKYLGLKGPGHLCPRAPSGSCGQGVMAYACVKQAPALRGISTSA